MHRVLGSKLEPLDPAWLQDRRAHFGEVMLDIGTGDGRFVLDAATTHPDRLVIGLDAVAENLAKSARQAASRKKGLPNALFLRGAAEALPGPLAGIADHLSVNYPWGSLLRIVAMAEPTGMAGIRATCRLGASVSILLNYSVFEDPDYLERLSLSAAVDVATSETFIERLRASGVAVNERRIIAGDPPIRTAWGRQLVRGAARKTLIVSGRAV